MARRRHGRCPYFGSGLWRLQLVGPIRFTVWGQIRAHGYDHSSPWDQGSSPAPAWRRPRLRSSGCQRSSQPRREGHQRAVGESEHWRAWHRDPDRIRLHFGRSDVPGFSGKLRYGKLAILASGRSLQAKARRLGGPHVQALEIVGSVPPLSIVGSTGAGRHRPPRCIFCGQTPH